MKRLIFLLIWGLILGCNPKDERPNIVFIFTDDQTYKSLVDPDYEFVKTPNMDRLADEGASFTHAYNMGGWNGAVCIASRTMLNTGLTVWRAQRRAEQWRNDSTLIKKQSWGGLMSAAGYKTYMTGKWHVVSADVELAFDSVRNERPGMPRDQWGEGDWNKVREAMASGEPYEQYVAPGYNRPQSKEDTSWLPWDKTRGGFWKGGKHWSEVVKDDALTFIDDAAQSDQPFFMYLAFNGPHDPRQAPREFVEQYDEDEIAIPENFLPVYPYHNEMGAPWTLRDEALAPLPRTDFAVRRHRKEYAGIISHLDAQLGQILEELDRRGLRDNTYIFFTSDHGLSVGEHGLIGKQSMFDHSVRVPFLVAGPGVAAGSQFDHDIYLQDVMPTTLELAGATVPEEVEFNSLLGYLNGEKKQSSYSEIYGVYTNKQRMIRKDGFKLIAYPEAKKYCLFDLNNDPNEVVDLADDPAHAERKEKLIASLLDLQRSMDDQWLPEEDLKY